MEQEIKEPCPVCHVIRRVTYLTNVYSAETELVLTICNMYAMGCYTQEEIGWKTLGEEMDRSSPVTVSVIKKILEANLDGQIRQCVDAVRRWENLQFADSDVQRERWKIAGDLKVLSSEDAMVMNSAEQLPTDIAQELIKKHTQFTAVDVLPKFSSKELRITLAKWLSDTHQIEKTPRAVQGILYRHKKKLKKWESRNEISPELRMEMYAHWEESFPKNGSPAAKGKWYSEYAEEINIKHSLEWQFLITEKNIKNVIQWINQKKKKKNNSL